MTGWFWQSSSTPRRRLWPALWLALLLAAPAFAGTVEPPLRVLLVGNSLIYHNDLAAHLDALGEAATGRDVQVEMVTGPGGRINQQQELGLVQAERARGNYGLVLQEWGGGLNCGVELAKFDYHCDRAHEAHRQLVEAAAIQGAQVLLLGTYSLRAASGKKLAANEAKLARELAIGHVSLGDLLKLAKKFPDLKWFDVDGYHPGPATTALMAQRLLDRMIPGARPYLATPVHYLDYRGRQCPRANAPTTIQQTGAAALDTTVQAPGWTWSRFRADAEADPDLD
ncbi:MAG: SGNH/GDSL hydrolase family protein [Ahniella sp.]|nr:SGNH/GDSL hydrolase family protein [Ahniella sp.]